MKILPYVYCHDTKCYLINVGKCQLMAMQRQTIIPLLTCFCLWVNLWDVSMSTFWKEYLTFRPPQSITVEVKDKWLKTQSSQVYIELIYNANIQSGKGTMQRLHFQLFQFQIAFKFSTSRKMPSAFSCILPDSILFIPLQPKIFCIL